MEIFKYKINKENFFFILLVLIPFFYISGSLLVNLSTLIVIITAIFFSEKRIFLNFLKKYKIYIFSFFVIIFFNILFSETKLFSLNKIILYLRFFLFTLCYIFLISRLTNNHLKTLSKFFLLLIAFVIFDSLIQLVFGKDLFGFEYFYPYNRITGPFGSEMIVGFYVLNFGILTISFLNYFFSINKIYNFLLFSILFLFILLTGERTSFLTSLYFLFFMFVFCKEKKFIFFTSISIFIISIIIIYNVNFLNNKYPIFQIYEKMIVEKSEKNELENSKVSSELINVTNNFMPIKKWQGHFDRSIEIFKKNIFFGSGFRNYRIVCIDYQEKYFNSVNISKCSTHPHNFHLEIISDNGISGYLIFLFFLVYIIKIFFNQKLYNEFGICVIFCLILSFVVPFKTTGSIFTTNYAFVFWYIISNYFFLIKKNS